MKSNGGGSSSGAAGGMTPGASFYVQVDPASPPQSGAFNISSGTINTQLNLPYLTQGNCLQLDATSGKVISAGAPCGSGGGGGTTIWSKKDGAALDNSVSTINVVSPLTATSSPSGQINITVNTTTFATLAGTQTYTGNPSYILTNSGAGMSIQANANTGTSIGNGTVVINKTSNTTGGGLVVETNAAQDTALNGLVYLHINTTSYNEPAIYILSVASGSIGAQADMRIDSNNPDIEMINKNLTNAGIFAKYEIAIPQNADYLQINGRNAADSAFQNIARFYRQGSAVGASGGIGSNALYVGTTGQILLGDSSDGHYVGFMASNTISANKVWVLPGADGSSGQFIQTDGNGNLSFGSSPAGSGATIFSKLDGASLDTAVSSINIQAAGGLIATSGPSGQINIGLSSQSSYYLSLPVAATTYATQSDVTKSTTNTTNTFANYYTTGSANALFLPTAVAATTYQSLSGFSNAVNLAGTVISTTTNFINNQSASAESKTFNVSSGTARNLGASTITANTAQYNTGLAKPTQSTGTVFWDSTEDSLAYYNASAMVTLNVGQENILRVLNNSGVTIANGNAVYMTGSNGSLPTVALARADVATSAVVAGIATMQIQDTTTGYITNLGLVHDLNLSAFSPGSILYLSSITAGALTQTAPPIRSRAAIAISTNSSSGVLMVSLGAPASSYIYVQDEGVLLPQQTALNFVGAGVTAANDAAGSRTTVTINGGGSAGTPATIAVSSNGVVVSSPAYNLSFTTPNLNVTVTGTTNTVTYTSTITTTGVPEGTNLYLTSARVNGSLTNPTTMFIANGTSFQNANFNVNTSSSMRVLTSSLSVVGGANISTLTITPLLDATTAFAIIGSTGINVFTVNTASVIYASLGIQISTTGTWAMAISTAGAGSPTLVGISTTGFLSFSGYTPAISGCGTSPTLGLNITDTDGTVTPGATATGCTVTFANPKKNIPHCVVTEQTDSIVNAFAYTITRAAVVVTQTSFTSAFNWHCDGAD